MKAQVLTNHDAHSDLKVGQIFEVRKIIAKGGPCGLCFTIHPESYKNYLICLERQRSELFIVNTMDKYQYKDNILKGSQHSGGDGNPSVKPIKNMFISDLKTAKDKLEFINKHGKEEFTNLVQKGKRPSK